MGMLVAKPLTAEECKVALQRIRNTLNELEKLNTKEESFENIRLLVATIDRNLHIVADRIELMGRPYTAITIAEGAKMPPQEKLCDLIKRVRNRINTAEKIMY